MNRRIVAAICCLLTLILPSVTYAISAQWDLDPISGDWNTAANWTPMGVPNGPADIATFGLSNTIDVSISADTEGNGVIFTPAATNPYTITVTSGLTLTISGVGTTNNAGILQHFVTDAGQIRFTNSSTVTGNVFIENDGSGSTNFFDSSTAGNSLIIDRGGISVLQFLDRSTAGNSNITAQGGAVNFSDTSTAGSATINILATGSGAFLSFEDSSRGGTARIELTTFGNRPAILDISAHNAPGVTIGSLEGNETAIVSLGANNLTIGSNNLSTTFSGVIQDGTGGSLTKIGSGTFILAGANTYTGDTNVNGGVLQVHGSITSNTFVNHGGTLAGTGTINGNVTNNGRVNPGDSPGVLTVVHNYTQAQYATLIIQIADMGPDQFSVLDVMGNANLSGFLDPVLLNGFVPTIGDSFTFLNYASFTGEFSHIKHEIFDNGMLQWSVIYQNNNAILTVGPNTIPDQGSAFLLLTLGLLGLLTFRRQLLRGQP